MQTGRRLEGDEPADEGFDDAKWRAMLERHLELDDLAALLADGTRPVFGAFINPEAMRSVRERIVPELDKRRAQLAHALSRLLNLPPLPAADAMLWPRLRAAARGADAALIERLARFGSYLPASLWLELLREHEALRNALGKAPPRGLGAREALEAELSNPDHEVARSVIRALGYLGDAQSQVALRRLLDAKPDAATRAALITAVTRCTSNPHEFTNGSAVDRAAAVEGIATATVASGFLGDEAPEVSAAARDVLRALEPKPVVEALAQVLTNGSIAARRDALEVLQPHELDVLDLSLGAFSDADADALIDHAAAFRHLAKLSFDENQLCTSLPRLRQALPNATFEEQRELDDDPCVAVNRLSDLASCTTSLP